GASVFAYTSLFRSGAAQWFEVGVGVVRAVGLDDVADGVGQPVPGGGAEEGRAAEPAQIEPGAGLPAWSRRCVVPRCRTTRRRGIDGRSEEHTSELQSRENLVCRLLLEKKKKKHNSS